MSECPEHEKLAQVKDQCRAIGEFIEWLGREGRIELCEWREVEEDDPAMEALLLLAGKEVRPRVTTKLMSISKGIDDLLADYFGIDNRKLEQEKLTMLARLRSSDQLLR